MMPGATPAKPPKTAISKARSRAGEKRRRLSTPPVVGAVAAALALSPCLALPGVT
jgi:hypothetical protein